MHNSKYPMDLSPFRQKFEKNRNMQKLFLPILNFFKFYVKGERSIKSNFPEDPLLFRVLYIWYRLRTIF